MSLSFAPQTEEEVLNLFKEGVYDFKVKAAEDTYSKKSGLPMIKLILAIISPHGEERMITDYLMVSLMYKLKHFCEAVGLSDKYEAGSLSAKDCINRIGKCKLRIDKSEGYNPKNSVQDYVENASPVIAKPTAEDFFDDALDIAL